MNTKILSGLVTASQKSQKEIATDLNMSQQRFNNYVNGQREPDLDSLCAIATYFGTSTDYLLGRNEKSPDADNIVPRDEQERNIIRMARELDPPQRALLLRLVETAVESRKER